MVCGLCAGHMSSATFVLSLQQSERQILLSGRRCWRTWSPSNGWCSRRQSSRTCVRSTSATTCNKSWQTWSGSWWWTSWSISLLSGGLEAMLLSGMLALTLSASQTARCNLICKEYLENYFFIFFSNQGMEGNHKEIKANHTFRTELPLGQFIQVLEKLVNSSHHFWSPK